jgi:N utilization substance protein A
LCPMLGKVIVLVPDDQLSLAIGKKGQNVRLASKLVGWDIHVMNQKKLDEQLDKSVGMFSKVPSVSGELAENLVAQGFFTFDDLSVIEPDQLAELGGLTAEQCEEIVAYADEEAARVEEEERRAIAEGRFKQPEPVVVVEAPAEPAIAGGNGAPKAEGDDAEAAVGAEVTDELNEAELHEDELHDEALAEEAAHSGADNGQEPPTLAATVLDEMTEASGEIADEAADAAPEPPETEPEMPPETEAEISEQASVTEGGHGHGGHGHTGHGEEGAG